MTTVRRAVDVATRGGSRWPEVARCDRMRSDSCGPIGRGRWPPDAVRLAPRGGPRRPEATRFLRIICPGASKEESHRFPGQSGPVALRIVRGAWPSWSWEAPIGPDFFSKIASSNNPEELGDPPSADVPNPLSPDAPNPPSADARHPPRTRSRPTPRTRSRPTPRTHARPTPRTHASGLRP
jgi:hypothetical protein